MNLFHSAPQDRRIDAAAESIADEARASFSKLRRSIGQMTRLDHFHRKFSGTVSPAVQASNQGEQHEKG